MINFNNQMAVKSWKMLTGASVEENPAVLAISISTYRCGLGLTENNKLNLMRQGCPELKSRHILPCFLNFQNTSEKKCVNSENLSRTCFHTQFCLTSEFHPWILQLERFITVYLLGRYHFLNLLLTLCWRVKTRASQKDVELPFFKGSVKI